ncbi:MAG: chemotaxis protein CheD [Desulfuromonadaceae bacterium]|nr:chemotaxis protein CheD [Desulfuromonadaceae bacterium]
MKTLIASHTQHIYLKPGEVMITRTPMLISTVLGSCVAVTIFSASRGFGAICHAMLPENTGRDNDFRYVDTALRHIHNKILEYGIGSDLVVKLFGGAQVLDVRANDPSRLTIGDQNVSKAEEELKSLGFSVTARDTGGLLGRKLFFCTRSGDVYMRQMRKKKPDL